MSGDGPTDQNQNQNQNHSPGADFFKEDRKRLHCPLFGCRRVYPDTDTLNTHVQDHQITTQSLPGKSFVCSALDCNSSFISMQSLMEHTRHHYKPNIYFLCESCRSKLRSYPALLKHINNCAKVAKGKAGTPGDQSSTDATPDPHLDHNANPKSDPDPDPDTPPVITDSSNMDQDPPPQPQHRSDPAPPPVLSHPPPPEDRPPTLSSSSSGHVSRPDVQMQAEAPSQSPPPRPRPLPLPQDQTPRPPLPQQPAEPPPQPDPPSAPGGSPPQQTSPPGSNAVRKKNQGSSFSSRILWEHTRGRYKCLQCGAFSANRPEMTAHIESHHKSPAPASKQASSSSSTSRGSSTPKLPPDDDNIEPARTSKSSSRRRTASKSSSSSWTDSFKVPWKKMPDDLQTAIANKTRPSLGDRRVMVRIVVDAMREHDPNPTRPKCAAVAAVIVRRHPESFADAQDDGTHIGTGYASLLSQLKIRVEHLNRGNTARRRRPARRPTPGAVVPPPARGQADQYGCVRWKPEAPPTGETAETLERKRVKLAQLYAERGMAGEDAAQVVKLMETTYYLQREALNAVPALALSDLKLRWPYLFSQTCLCAHFQMLTDVPVLARMKEAFAAKGEKILKLFEQNLNQKDTEVRRVLSAYAERGDSCMAACIVLLLTAHFKEKTDALFLQAEASATAADVERSLTLPAMPRLILLGKTLMTSCYWMLSMEGQVVAGPYPDVAAGLAALFACFYVFNMKYEDEAACTLEFIQRSFVCINPATGTKTRSGDVIKSGRVVQKKRAALNPRVCTLLLSLMDFEWPPA